MKILYRLSDIEKSVNSSLEYSILSFPFYNGIEESLNGDLLEKRFFSIFYGRLGEQLFIDTFNVQCFDNREIFYKPYDDGDAIFNDTIIDIKTSNIDRLKFFNLPPSSIKCNLKISTVDQILDRKHAFNKMYIFLHADFSLFQLNLTEEEKNWLCLLTKNKEEIRRSRLQISEKYVDMYKNRIFKNNKFSNTVIYDTDAELLLSYTSVFVPDNNNLQLLNKGKYSYYIESSNLKNIEDYNLQLRDNYTGDTNG